jgi:hypothetical protein
MGTTPIYGLPYPDATDAPEVWSDMEALADAVDTELDVLQDALTAFRTWTSFTPTFLNNQISGTPAAVTKTVTRAKYCRLGVGANSLVIAMADITATAAASNGFGIGLPITAAERFVVAGVLGVYGGTPPTQTGHAYMAASLDKLHATSFTSVFQDCANGQSVRYLVAYMSAS